MFVKIFSFLQLSLNYPLVWPETDKISFGVNDLLKITSIRLEIKKCLTFFFPTEITHHLIHC